MTGYELSRSWFDYCFENPEKVRPIHTALFFFAIEHCNRLGWKKKFGFPTQMVMEALGIKNWRTYSRALDEVVEFGFIEIIERSKNQYSSNIIAIVKNTKATTKATTKSLDKALQNHSQKQSQSTVDIDKQYNNKQITINNKQEVDFFYNNFSFFKDDFQKIWFTEFIPLKKKKKAALTERALTSQLNKIQELSGGNYEKAFKILNKSVNSGWTDFYPLKEEQLNGKKHTIDNDIQNSPTRLQF